MKSHEVTHKSHIKVKCNTAKKALISSDFLAWKFCGEAQFPHNFGKFAQNYVETVPFLKIFTPGNQVKLRYLLQILLIDNASKTLFKAEMGECFKVIDWPIVHHIFQGHDFRNRKPRLCKSAQKFYLLESIIHQSLHKKWRFPLRIYPVNVTKFAENCGFGHIYWRNP